MRLDSLEWKLSYGGARFWNALFDILDKEKKNPLRNHQDRIIVSIDEDYQLVATERYMRVVSKTDQNDKKGVMRYKFLEDRGYSKVFFPYSGLLEWYLNSLISDYEKGGAA